TRAKAGDTVSTVKRAPAVAATIIAFLAAAATARAGDAPAPPQPPDPCAAALARVRTIEQQVVSTVDAICQSSVTVFNKTIPKEDPKAPKGQPVSREPHTTSGGSGVIISRSGKIWILTNHHVVDHA